MKQKLFTLLTALVLSSSMSMWGAKKVTYLSEGDFKTSVYEYIGTTSTKGYPIYCYQWSDELMLYMTFKSSLAGSWTYNGNTYVMPAKGSYAVQASSNAERAVGNNQSGWNGDTKSMIKDHAGDIEYLYTGTITVEEGADGPYIYSSNLTEIYYSSYYGRNVQDGYFEIYIGSPATYRTVSVVSNNTTMGTVSYTYKSGYVYANNRLQEFKDGSVYTLTATPKSGYRFVRWEKNGSQISTDATTDVTITGDATYTAYFESNSAPQYTITVQTATPDYCTVSGGGTYYAGTNVTISSASKNEHLYIFDMFMLEGEDEDLGEPSFEIEVTGNATYTAYYRLAKSGTITAATNNASYGTASASLTGSQPGGTAVTLTATPYGGYAFTGWDDNDDGVVDNTDAVRTVYVDGNKEYVANFIVETASYASFSFDNPNDNIQIDKYTEPAAQCQTSFYPYGISLVEIIAKNTTRTSKNYLQMYIKTNNFRTYNPVSGGSYYGPAYGTYSVSVPSEYGPVIGNCDNSIYESNYYFVYTGNVTDVVIGFKVETASHGGTCHYQGYEGTLSQRLCVFSSYGADYSNETRSNFATFNEGTITVAEGAGGHPYITIRIGGTLVASIGAPAQPYNLAWDANGGNITVAGTAAGSVTEGASITAPTVTRTGYTFNGWSPEFTGYMPAANTTYVAQWTANTYNVSFAAGDGSGAAMANQNFTYGVAQHLTANTYTGPAATITYDYNGATGGNSPASATVHATFANWTDGVNSYADEAEVNNLTATNGATVAMTANWSWTEKITLPSPTKTGYTFNHWEFGEAPLFLIAEAGDEFTPDEDVTMTAQWNIVTYDLTYEGLEGATNTNPATYNVESETITLADPGTRDGYAFTGWTINGTPVTEITHGSTGDKTITANWQVNSHAVAVVSNNVNYGTVSADAISNVKDGMEITVSENTLTLNSTTVTATAKAEDGLFTYAFAGWTDDDGNALPETVSDNMTIRANFTRSTKSSITLNESGTDDYYDTFKSEYWGTEGEKAETETVTVTYNRQFKQGYWSTLCLPFAVEAPIMRSTTLGLIGSVYEFKYATGDANVNSGVTLYFARATKMNAGQCYIVNANSTLAGKSSFTFSNVKIDLKNDKNDKANPLNSASAYDNLPGTPDEPEKGTIQLVGTLRKGTLKGGTTYMGLKDNTIYYPNTSTGNTILAYRGVFRLVSEESMPIRFRMVVDGEDMGDLEVINGEMVEATEARKFVQDGILYIERDGVLYNAQGQKVGKVEN